MFGIIPSPVYSVRSHPQSIIIKTVNKIAHNPLSSMMRVKLLTQNVLFLSAPLLSTTT